MFVEYSKRNNWAGALSPQKIDSVAESLMMLPIVSVQSVAAYLTVIDALEDVTAGLRLVGDATSDAIKSCWSVLVPLLLGYIADSSP